MHRKSKERVLLFLGFLLTFFLAVHSYAFLQYLVLYGTCITALSCVSWQLATLVQRYLPQKCVSPNQKSVLITGCDTGFGHQLARRLCEKGYYVWAACLFPSEEGATSLRQDYGSDKMHVFGMDVTKDDDVKSALTHIKAQLKSNGKVLWAIVNNAGIATSCLVEMGGMDIYRKLLEVNQLGVVRVTKAFLPLLRQSKGRLICMASLAGRISFGGIVAYSMTKYAVVGLCEGLRREMWKWGVKVISIEPTMYNRTCLVPDEDGVRSMLGKIWEDTDPEIRDAYGQQYFEAFLNKSIRSSKTANANINEVVDTQVNAVILEQPEDVNTVGSAIERFGLWLYNLLPVKLQDCLLVIIQRDGLPVTPREWITTEFGI